MLGGRTALRTIDLRANRIGKQGVRAVAEALERSERVRHVYVHAGGKLGVLVALKSPDSGAEIEALAKDVAMHVAAADPTPVAVTVDGVSKTLLESERDIYRKQALQEGKPEKVVDRIVDGKIQKFVKDICLVEQPFVKDPDRTVGNLLEAAGASVSAFERFKLGQVEEEADSE